MNYFVVVFGIIFITLAFTVMIHPRILKSNLAVFLDKKWLWPVSFIRILLGIALIYTAEDTSASILILTFGIIIVLAGITAPMVGTKRIEAFAQWWMNQNEFFIRILGFFALLLGIAIAMAGLPS